MKKLLKFLFALILVLGFTGAAVAAEVTKIVSATYLGDDYVHSNTPVVNKTAFVVNQQYQLFTVTYDDESLCIDEWFDDGALKLHFCETNHTDPIEWRSNAEFTFSAVLEAELAKYTVCPELKAWHWDQASNWFTGNPDYYYINADTFHDLYWLKAHWNDATQDDPSNHIQLDITGYQGGICDPDVVEAREFVRLEFGNPISVVDANDDPPTLTIVKQIKFDDQGVASIGDFAIDTGAGTPVFATPGVTVGDVTTYTATPLVVDLETPYYLTESDVAGYAEYDWSCSNGTTGPYNATSVTLNAGGDVTCTIMNERENYNLTVIKNLRQRGLPDQFIMDADGTLGAEGEHGATSTARVFYGDAAYIDELAGPDTDLYNWNAYYRCKDPNLPPEAAPFAAGQGHRFEFIMPAANLDCTITNDRKKVRLILVKEAIGFDGEFCLDLLDSFGQLKPRFFCFYTTGGRDEVGPLNWWVNATFGFTEVIEGDYVLASATCSNGDTPDAINLVPDSPPVICTWVNVLPTAVPVNNVWALLLMALMVLGVGWYYRPARVGRS